MRPLTYTLLTLGLLAAALALLPQAVYAQEKPKNLVITITDRGITSNVSGPLGGLYIVTVHNKSSRDRGIVMRGIDRGVSPYIRFTKVLNTGQQTSFRWYFPSDRIVTMKDLLYCHHAQRTCAVASVGRFMETLTFG